MMRRENQKIEVLSSYEDLTFLEGSIVWGDRMGKVILHYLIGDDFEDPW